MSERKAIGKTKVGLIICASLVVILAVSNGWLLTRVVSLQNQVSILQTDKSGLEGQVISLQGEFEQLQSSYATLNDSYITLDTNFNQLSSEFEVLSSNYVNLTETYTAILNNFNRLTENYEALSIDFNELSQTYTTLLDNYDELLNNYDILSGNYSTLLDAHQTLQDQYFTLNTLYQQLQTDYETVQTTYINLLEQYEKLLELWNEPLEYVVTPTWDEVIAWLETDQTDAIAYDSEKFLCGDFSIMLIQHAKAMHWRMLFTVIEFDLYDENPTGIERHHGYNGHAFVSLFTTEGIVYIEPQTDFTWYLYDPADPGTHVEFPEWEFIDFGADWFGNIFVQYYNRMATDVDSIENSSTSIEVRVLHTPTNNDNPHSI